MKVLLAVCLLFLGSGLTTIQSYAQSPDLDLKADAAMVVNTENNQVLYNINGDEVRPIASLTKMIVQFIVLDEVQNGSLNWEDEVHISPFLSELSVNFILANVPLSDHQTYTVRELFEAMSVYSANAATIALAEHIEGSEESFVHRMRDLVNDWGIQDAHIVNTTGLHNSFMEDHIISDSHEDDENKMSARSALIVASKLIEEHPEVLETSEMTTLDFPTEQGPFVVENWNKMLPGLSQEYPGVRGLKTGTTEAAGRSFVGYVEDDESLLTIVLNAGDLENEEDRYRRYEDTATLMDYHLENWDYETVMTADEFATQFKNVPIENGYEDTVPLRIDTDIELAVNNNNNSYTITEHFNEDKINQEGHLIAPIKENEVIGEAVIELNDSIEYLTNVSFNELSVPIYASQTVERQSWMNRLISQVVTFFEEMFNELAL